MGHQKTFSLACAALALLSTGQPISAEPWTLATKANNIHCTMGDDPDKTSMLCTLSRRTGPTARPKPADCADDWGHAYFLEDHGAVRMLCMQKVRHTWPGNLKFDTVGVSDQGRVSCNATRSTLECINNDGHGFYLSRKEQRVF